MLVNVALNLPAVRSTRSRWSNAALNGCCSILRDVADAVWRSMRSSWRRRASTTRPLSYLLASHKLYPAIDLFRRHRLFRWVGPFCTPAVDVFTSLGFAGCSGGSSFRWSLRGCKVVQVSLSRQLRSCVKVELTVLAAVVSVDVKQHFNRDRTQALCESRGGRPGHPSLISLWFLWT